MRKHGYRVASGKTGRTGRSTPDAAARSSSAAARLDFETLDEYNIQERMEKLTTQQLKDLVADVGGDDKPNVSAVKAEWAAWVAFALQI